MAVGLLGLAGCSTAVREAPALHHDHEVALAWADDKSADAFHFPIACPGPEKRVLFDRTEFDLVCDLSERLKAKVVAVASDQLGGGEVAPPLKCHLVVVPDYEAIAGVLADMRKGITAKRTGPLDCTLIRYD